MSATVQPEKMEFRTELKQLLHIITHSLYSNKEIFLRELISNAADAINKIRFDALSHEELLEGDRDWKIRISVDREAGTLIVSDNGIGLSRESAIQNLGTIAHSGTRAFLEALRSKQAASQPELIGQFGVGFYSAFMVADRVTVLSRLAGSPDAIRWESDGQGEFTVEPGTRPTRGTDVILHLKKEEQHFLDPHTLRSIIRKFSDFIEHPVVMDVEKEVDGQKTTVEEVVNSRKAIWLRNRADNTPEEYATFYRQISSDHQDPLKVVHYGVEGAQEFKALLFVPTHRPFEMEFGEFKWGLRLYIQRVLIMEHCEALLPPYLRFVRGVVDSADLPLNISRELLQDNPLLEQIRRNVTRSTFRALEELKNEEYEKYVAFHNELGSVLKEGLTRDWDNREKIADLLLFASMNTPAGQFTTLAKYIEAMPADQKDVWYLTGETREQLEHSPYLEAFRARGQDVLLLTDPIDAFALPGLHSYKGKTLHPIDRADPTDTVEQPLKERYARLLEHLEGRLSEVADVRLTGRLKDSAACLVAAEGAVSAHMERLMQRWGRDAEMLGGTKRVLELNGAHPAVEALLRRFERNADDPAVECHARLLYDQAVIAEGSRVKDPAAMARRINELLVRDVPSTTP